MVPPESADSSRYFARFAAFVALTIGLFVFAGWLLDLDQLTNIVPGWPRMPMLAATGFMLNGIALCLTTLRALRPATAASALLVMIGALVLLRDAAGWNAHIDQFSLATIPAREAGLPPARMAPATAFALTMLGLSLLFSFPRRTAVLHQALAITALLVGWLGLSHYVFGGDTNFLFSNMPVHSAILLLLLSAAALSLRTDVGIAAL